MFSHELRGIMKASTLCPHRHCEVRREVGERWQGRDHHSTGRHLPTATICHGARTNWLVGPSGMPEVRRLSHTDSQQVIVIYHDEGEAGNGTGLAKLAPSRHCQPSEHVTSSA